MMMMNDDDILSSATIVHTLLPPVLQIMSTSPSLLTFSLLPLINQFNYGLNCQLHPDENVVFPGK